MQMSLGTQIALDEVNGKGFEMKIPPHLLLFASGLLALMFPILSYASLKVEECQSRPDFVGNQKSSSSIKLEALPPLLFVARKVDYYVENKEQTFKIWGRQSVTRIESKILCANVSTAPTQYGSLRFSLYAPTLIDLTKDQKVGDSFWQFHLSTEGSQLGIWNQKSRMFSKVKNFESQMSKMGVQVQIFQISHDEFELVLKREVKSFFETLSIRFETISEVL